jgi:hypothetical protein
MKRINKTYLVVNFVYLAIVSAIVAQALSFGGEAGLVPLVIGIPTLAMILISIGGRLLPLPSREEPARAPAAAAPEDVASWSRGGVIIAWVAGFFLSIFLFGFYWSVPLYTLAFLKVEGRRSWLKCAITAAVLWAVVYVSFGMLMGQGLFKGVLFHALLPNL